MDRLLDCVDFDNFNIKTYLSQIEKNKIMISAKINQLKELREFSNDIGCSNLNSIYCKINLFLIIHRKKL